MTWTLAGGHNEAMPDATWTNWAREQRCAPAAREAPRDEGEVGAALARAAEKGQTVRVAGAGHSFSDLVCTDGRLLTLEHMDRLLDVDRDGARVRVQAGIGLEALGHELARHGLAMENLGDIDAQSLAGALATGTHGTGARFANLSAQVVGMRLVTATGEAIEIDGGEDLRAARIALGALGVVTELTLRCLPLFTLHRIDEPRPLDEVLESLDALVAGHDHFEFFAFPYSGRALVRRTQRTDAEPVRADPRRVWIKEELFENGAIAAAGAIGRRLPRAIPAISRTITRLAGREERTELSYRLYASRRAVRFTEMENAIPREHARAAVEAVLGVVQRRRLPIGFPIEVRFVAGDDAMLSPAHARDSCYIAVHQFRGQEYETYFRAVEEVLEPYGPRPHWGKRHYQSAATLAPRYPQWDAFQAVRARLDPERRFTNPSLRRLLGD